MGSACNLSCYFCSNRYNPPWAKVINVPYIPLEVIRELISYLDPEKKVIIGESATRFNEGEPLFHPDFLNILKEVRKHFPRSLIQVTTNGVLLDCSLQEELKSLMPMELVISFNSLKETTRSTFLSDPNPQQTIRNFLHLKRSNIPFQASFLLTPPFISEFPQSLRVAEELGASYIRLLLPGGTRWAPRELQASMAEWKRLKKMALSWRTKLSVPLMVEPPLVEDLYAEVEGVLRNSPAERASLKVGDVIQKVNDLKPLSRCEAFAAINREKDPVLEVKRKKEVFSATLFKEKKERGGLIFANDLYFDSLRRTISRAPSGGKGACLTSELAYKVVALASSNISREIQVFPVFNGSFGGSIRALGLLTVEDFRLRLSELKEEKLDWVILNPVFIEDGLDLRGVGPSSLEEEFHLSLIFSEP